jgi:hypothetical protein
MAAQEGHWMEAQFDELDEQLVKLEAEAAQASGEARRTIEEQIEKLRELRAQIAAGGDVVLASGEDNELQDETEEAKGEVRQDIP